MNVEVNAQLHSLLVEVATERLRGEYPRGQVQTEYAFRYKGRKTYRVDVVGANNSQTHAYECVVTTYPPLTKLEALKDTFDKVTILTATDVVRRAMKVLEERRNTVSEQKRHIMDLEGLVAHCRQERFHLKEKIRDLKWEIQEQKRKVRYWRKKAQKKR